MWISGTNRSRANKGVVNVLYLPGVGVEGDSPRDPVMPSLPCGLENVVGEGWESCDGVLGLVRTSFDFPTVLNTGLVRHLMSKSSRRLHTVVGPRDFASSRSPHGVQQRARSGSW